MFAAWFKFKSELYSKTNEIKNHADISVQKLNGMLTSVIGSFDKPAWVKVATTKKSGDIEFRMLELNSHYSKFYGISRNDYLGKTDLEAGWDKKISDKFKLHDLKVWSSGEPETFTEEINGIKTRFRKIRVETANGKLKGVMGYAIDCFDPSSCPYKTKDIKEDDIYRAFRRE